MAEVLNIEHAATTIIKVIWESLWYPQRKHRNIDSTWDSRVCYLIFYKSHWSFWTSLKGPHIRHRVAPPKYFQLYHLRRDNKAAEPLEASSISLQILSTIIMASENPSMTLNPKYDHYDYPTAASTKQTGHPGHLTPEQEAQVFQLRTMLEQKGYTERLDTLTMVWIWNGFFKDIGC